MRWPYMSAGWCCTRNAINEKRKNWLSRPGFHLPNMICCMERGCLVKRGVQEAAAPSISGTMLRRRCRLWLCTAI